MSNVEGLSTSSAICISDIDRRIVFTSDNHLKVLGRKRFEVIGQSWETWMPAKEVDLVEPQFREFWRTKKPYEVVCHMIQHDGSLLAVVSRCTVIKGDNPRTDLLFCEFEALEQAISREEADRFGCAAFVQDLTYELASVTGRNKLPGLTNALLEASASAERAVEMLAQAAETVRG